MDYEAQNIATVEPVFSISVRKQGQAGYRRAIMSALLVVSCLSQRTLDLNLNEVDGFSWTKIDVE